MCHAVRPPDEQRHPENPGDPRTKPGWIPQAAGNRPEGSPWKDGLHTPAGSLRGSRVDGRARTLRERRGPVRGRCAREDGAYPSSIREHSSVL